MSQETLKLLGVQLTDAEKRRIKSLAASRGMSLRQVVQQALEAWVSQVQPEGAAILGPVAGIDSRRPGRPAGGPQRERKPANPASTGGGGRPGKRRGGQPPLLEGAAMDWFRAAGQLDWSKCSAVESVSSKVGKVWAVRETQVPLAAVFRRLAEGHDLGEVAEAYGLSREQLKPILQFASLGPTPPAPAR